MDVADVNVGQLRVKDEVGVRCQKLFQDFLEECVCTVLIGVPALLIHTQIPSQIQGGRRTQILQIHRRAGDTGPINAGGEFR